MRISRTFAARAAPIGCAALIVLVTAAVFHPLVWADSIEWDDPHNVFRNPHLHPPALANLLEYWDFRRAAHRLYVPITHTAWFMIASLARTHDGSLNPHVYHAANLLIHALCAAAVFALLRSLVHNEAAAVLGALLFALHPVQVESVAWISGLKDLLCGLFGVFALWFYVLSRSAQRKSIPAHALYLLSTLAYVLALLSKPGAVALPVMAALIDLGLLRRRAGDVVISLAPWIILAIPIALITRSAQWTAEVQAMMPLHLRPLIVGDAIAFYVRQLIFPWRLALDYGRSPAFVAANPWNWLWWLVPLGIGGALAWLYRRAPSAVIGAMLFGAALVPVLGIVPFSAQLHSTVADHYLYLPMVGVALLLASIVAAVPSMVAMAIVIPILVVLGWRSWDQTKHWRDTSSIFTRTLQINPRSWIAHINLGGEALARNDAALAELHTREAMKLRPGDSLLWLNLGIALGQQSRFDDAADALRRAVEFQPDAAPCHYYLAEALLQLRDLDGAERHFRECERLAPGRFAVSSQLARIERARKPLSDPAQ